MKNLFTFPIHIFTEHHHVCRYKQYLTNIKILTISIKIATTTMMLVINSKNNNINNNYNKKNR